MPVSLSMVPSVQLLAVRWQGKGPGMLCPSVNKKLPSLADTTEVFCNLALGGFHNLARGPENCEKIMFKSCIHLYVYNRSEFRITAMLKDSEL